MAEAWAREHKADETEPYSIAPHMPTQWRSRSRPFTGLGGMR